MSKLLPIEEKLERPEGGTLFALVSYELDESYYRAKESTVEIFSPVLYESVPMPRWMLPIQERTVFITGSNTRILSFERRIHREELPSLYGEAVKTAKKIRKIDPTLRIIPGYLTRQNVVLGSHQDDFHKIYLFHGVFGEIIYKYIGSKLIVQETAPSFFHTRESIYFFTNLRESHEYNLKPRT